MPILRDLAQERTDLTTEAIGRLESLVGEWSLIADLSMSDLVLWLPTWNEAGLVAGALVRPNTAPTKVADDVVGSFLPRGRRPDVDQAAALGRVVASAYPVRGSDGRVIAVVERHSGDRPRVAGRLEEVYRQTADDLLQMMVEGTFPAADALDEALEAPRVGDGLIRVGPNGRVAFASPNAVSALRRLGLATDVLGADLHGVVMRLSHRPGPLEEALERVVSGRVEGKADIDNAAACVAIHGIPLHHGQESVGTLFLLCDVTEVRRRERALVSKDATIREIHHRVKNNLQTVAALLRLQARRATTEESAAALAEAERRVASIAIVHDLLAGEGGARVDFDEVLDRLIPLLRDLADQGSGQAPAIAREGSCGAMATEQASALAMIASELLQNAIEHAAAGSIAVRLQRGDGEIVVTVSDDGIGMAEDVEQGLGLQIVQSLVTGELRGDLQMTAGDPSGLVVRVRVPEG